MSTNKSQKIEVNSASIVDLKAELFRRQEEVRLKRTLNGSEKPFLGEEKFVDDEATDDHLYDKSAHKISRLSKKVLGASASAAPADTRRPDKKAKSVESKAANVVDPEMKREEENALTKSRAMLERKAKLYEQMASGSVMPDADNEELLVDFERKTRYPQTASSKDDETSDDEDELVEYEDEFGRTRMVKRKDLPQIAQPQRDHQQQQQYDGGEGESCRWTTDSDLMSEDMRREIERRQWEEDTRREMENTKAKVHYEDVREGEIRDHGVAFFNFSADEEIRAKQMEMLETMRQETESKKNEKQRIKEKRKQMLKARLAKVAARKGIALPDEPSDQSDNEEPEEKKKMEITIEKAKLKLNKDPVKVGRVRDWDLGKEGLFASRSTEDRAPQNSTIISQQRYVEKLREERNAEFAPPSIYSQTKSTFSHRTSSDRRFNNTYDRPDVREESYDDAQQDIAALVGDKLSQIRRNL